MRKVRIRNQTNCPFCGNIAKRVCFSYDKTEKYAVYYCDECGGTFTLIIKKNNNKYKGRFGFR